MSVFLAMALGTDTAPSSWLRRPHMTVEVDRGYFWRRPAAPSTDEHLDPKGSGALLRMHPPRSRASLVFTARRH